VLPYAEEQTADLRGEGGGCGDSEAEGEDLKEHGADYCEQDYGEEFVPKCRAGGEVDVPVSAGRMVCECAMRVEGGGRSRIKVCDL
jgi:hypothetical protein